MTLKKTPKTTRICINALLLQSPLDGIGNFGFYLIQNLRIQHPEWKISLLVNKKASQHFKSLEGLEIIEVDLTATWTRLIYLQVIFPILALRFDLVHSIANMGLIFCPVPQVVTVHDAYEYITPERFSGKLKVWQLRVTKALSCRDAARVLVDSQNTFEDMERYYPALHGKMEVVSLGAKFQVEPYRGQVRTGFVAHGTLDVGRNLEQVLQAYALFGAKETHKLVLFGVRLKGKEAPLPALLESMGLREHVELHGYVSDEKLQDLYRNSLAFIRAQSYDGFGLPVIEAMACGCPTLVARNSSLVEVGGEAALFFETNDVARLAAQMTELDEDPAFVERVSRKSLEHAAEFTWEKTTRKTADAYLASLKPRA